MYKKILLAVFLISSLSSMAMKTKTAYFDFHNYTTLTPKVDFGNSSKIGVKNIYFISDEVTFNAYPGALAYFPYLNQNVRPGYAGLQLEPGVMLHLFVPSDCNILKVDLTQGEYYDNVDCFTPSGSTSGSTKYGIWYSNGENESDVLLYNGSALNGAISIVEVIYQVPTNTLKYTSVVPGDSSVLKKFTGFTLTYSDNIYVENDSAINIIDEKGDTACVLNANAEDNTVVLTPTSELITAGNYKLVVPEGAFVSLKDTTYNKQIEIPFTLKEKEDTYLWTSMIPSEENVDSIPNPITLSMPTSVGHVVDTTFVIKNSKGTVVRTFKPVISTSNDSTVELTFQDGLGTIKERGVYNFTIPEQIIYNDKYDATAADMGIEAGCRYNPEKTYTFVVDGASVPSEAVVNKAKEVISQSGLGYPTDDCTERVALKAGIDYYDQTGEEQSADSLAHSVTSFINTTNVAMPGTSKYYVIGNVSTDDASVMYIKRTLDGYVLTSDVNDAEHFLFTQNTNAPYTIMAADSTIVTAGISKALPNEVLTDDQCFGKFTLSNVSGLDLEAIGATSPLFVFNETTVPDPITKYSVSPSTDAEYEELPSVTVTIADVDSLTYNSAKEITISGDNGTKKIVTDVKVNGNVITLGTNLEPEGNYTLNIPKGTFTYKTSDRVVEVPGISPKWLVSSAHAFNYDFDNVHHLSTPIDPTEKQTSNVMNNIRIQVKDTAKVVLNPENEGVELLNAKDSVLYKGSLVVGYDPEWARDIINFKFNTVFDAENLPDGQYTFRIKKASFGDGPYADYLANPTLDKKPLCHLNKEYTLTYDVKNSPDNTYYSIVTDTTTVYQALASVQITLNNDDVDNKVESLKYDSEKVITLTADNGSRKNISGITTKGNTITLPTNIEETGVYAVNVPDSAFSYSWKGLTIYAPAFTATWKVVVPDIITKFTVLTPTDSVYESLPSVQVAVSNNDTINKVNSLYRYDNPKEITLSNGEGDTIIVTDVKTNGNVITLATNITDDGEWTLNIPDSTFFYLRKNKVINVPAFAETWTVKVTEPVTTCIAVTPADTVYEALPTVQIAINNNDSVNVIDSLVCDSTKAITLSNNAGETITITDVKTAGNVITLATNIDDDGDWTVNIPDSTFSYKWKKRMLYAPAFAEKWTVKVTEPVTTCTAVTPADTVYEALPTVQIAINNNDSVNVIDSLVCDSTKAITLSNKEGETITITDVKTAGNVITLATNIDDDGDWTVNIPDSTFSYKWKKRILYAPAFDRTWTVKVTEPVTTCTAVTPADTVYEALPTVQIAINNNDSVNVIDSLVCDSTKAITLSNNAGETITITDIKTDGNVITLATNIDDDGDWTVNIPDSTFSYKWKKRMLYAPAFDRTWKVKVTEPVTTCTAVTPSDTVYEALPTVQIAINNNDSVNVIDSLLCDSTKAITLSNKNGETITITDVKTAGNVITLATNIDDDGDWTVNIPDSTFSYKWKKRMLYAPAFAGTWMVKVIEPVTTCIAVTPADTVYEALPTVQIAINNSDSVNVIDSLVCDSTKAITLSNNAGETITITHIKTAGNVITLATNIDDDGDWTVNIPDSTFSYKWKKRTLYAPAFAGTWKVKVTEPVTDYSILTPADSIYDSLSMIQIAVSNNDSVNVIDNLVCDSAKAITLTNGKGKTVTVTDVKTDGNVITLATNIEEDGEWTLNIPDSTFSYKWKKHTLYAPAITSATAWNVYPFRYDYGDYYYIHSSVDTINKVSADTLNAISLYVDQLNGFVLAPANDGVELLDNNGSVLYRGSLEVRNEASTRRSYLDFKFDVKFNEDNLPDGKYTFRINKGCFGDSRYGEYLETPTVDNKIHCHMNDVFTISYTVDKSSVGIESVISDSPSKHAVYDLSGRRVTGAATKGIYIINGKKVVMK